MPSPSPKPIFYGKKLDENGCTVRVDSRDVIRVAIEKRVPIIIEKESDFINLYHIFERAMEKLPEAERTLKLCRRRINKTTWRITILDKDQTEEAELEAGYDPKRGRYKRYAKQLADGGALTFSDRAEAVKARRAWQLYVPKAERKHLRSTMKFITRTENWLLCILPRAG